MRYPVPPFLEMSFYFADIPDAAAFKRVLGALVSEGARFTGSGTVHRGAGVRHRPFAGITDQQLESVEIANLQEAEFYATADDMRLVQVGMADASAARRGGREIVNYVSISPEAAASDHHPIAIVSTGSLFDGPAISGRSDKSERRQRRQLGTRLYRRFLKLIRALEPSYAAFTMLDVLECPTDLRRDPRSGAFTDFYFDATFLGAGRTQQVLSLFPGAYREPVAQGWYISCYGNLNPKHSEVENRISNVASSAVASIIAAAVR